MGFGGVCHAMTAAPAGHAGPALQNYACRAGPMCPAAPRTYLVIIELPTPHESLHQPAAGPPPFRQGRLFLWRDPCAHPRAGQSPAPTNSMRVRGNGASGTPPPTEFYRQTACRGRRPRRPEPGLHRPHAKSHVIARALCARGNPSSSFPFPLSSFLLYRKRQT